MTILQQESSHLPCAEFPQGPIQQHFPDRNKAREKKKANPLFQSLPLGLGWYTTKKEATDEFPKPLCCHISSLSSVSPLCPYFLPFPLPLFRWAHGSHISLWGKWDTHHRRRTDHFRCFLVTLLSFKGRNESGVINSHKRHTWLVRKHVAETGKARWNKTKMEYLCLCR